jgi:hypothetical protein
MIRAPSCPWRGPGIMTQCQHPCTGVRLGAVLRRSRPTVASVQIWSLSRAAHVLDEPLSCESLGRARLVPRQPTLAV